MDKKLKFIIFLVVAILAGFTAWTVTTIPEPPKEDEKPKAETVKMTYKDNTIHEEDFNGKIMWEVTAQTMEMDTVTQSTVFRNATGRYYMKDGNILTLTAPSGVYNGETRDVKMEGGVVATTTDEGKLESDELTWDSKGERIIATGHARVSKQDFFVTGDRIEAWDGMNSFKAEGHAHIEKNSN